MKRREFLFAGTALAGCMATGLWARPLPRRRRPNVLYVFSDQHRACEMPGEQFNQAMAPTLAAFRAANTSMDQCTSNYPLCTPYRGIFMSGLYPQQSGVLGNYAILDPKVAQPLGETFRRAGYHTGYIGKWHIHGQPRVGGEDVDFIPAGPFRMGFEHWRVWANTNDHYNAWTFDQDSGEKIVLPGWQPVRMTDQAIDFLKAQKADKPWLLVVSWNPPHPPFDPPEEEKQHYPADAMKFRPNAHTDSAGELNRGVRNDAALRRSAQGYLGSITGIDEQFARILKTLDETGQAGDTIIVYTSDHGEMLGSQGLMGKRVPFEESCRVPFIVRYPGVTKDRYKSQTLFSAVDVYPTLCGLAGVPVPAHCAGRDLSDAMRGRSIQEPEHVFLLSDNEHGAGPGGGGGGGARRQGGPAADRPARARGVPRYRGVRTKTHTYVVADSGRWLLYDNVADPFQTKNLIDDENHGPLMARLDGVIEQWMRSVKDSFPYAQAKAARYDLTTPIRQSPVE